MESGTFIHETSNNRWQRAVAILFIGALIAVGVIILLSNLLGWDNPIGHLPQVNFLDLVNDITPLKLFIIMLLGGMIFFPLPTELAFYFSIVQGHPIYLCIGLSVLGILIGNFVNYFLGSKMSHQVTYLLSAKSFFKVRRQVNKWGAYAIFFMNIIPSPSDILGVGLGAVKYSKRRFFLISTIATSLKFIIIAVVAIYMQRWI